MEIAIMAVELKLDKNYLFYLNGDYVPVGEAKISVLDAGLNGDSVFDTLRTVNRNRVIRMEHHLERLYSSCKAAEIDPGIKPEKMKEIITEVMNRNAGLLEENDDAWISVRITSGYRYEKGKATVIVSFVPLPFKTYAKYFKLGTHLAVPTIRHVPPQCMDPKIKYDARLFMHMADRETKRAFPESRTLLLDLDGNIAELTDASFFIVKNGQVLTPTERNILPGVSRQIVLELCEKLKIPVSERDIQLYDAYTADEAFQSGTSYRMLPVSRINGRHLWKKVPGPVTGRLLAAYSEEIGIDIEEQYLSHLSHAEREALEKEAVNAGG
jgi:branched-chain amino acid aminotransferase